MQPGDGLTVRGRELAARVHIYNYDTELAGDCRACMSECTDEACDRECDCDYEEHTLYERTLVVRDGRLVLREPECFGFD
jgi:hypothetical protein